MTITGNNFTGLTGASAVKFGGSNATSYTINSATQITATAPPGAGTVDVTVTTPGGTSATSAADQFTYMAAPIAEYRFDEGSAGTVTDSSGNSLSGTLNGGVTVGGSGKLCTGYNFNGSNAFVSVPNTALLNPTQITVAAWVRHSTATIKNWEAILAKGDSAYRMHLNGGCSINNNNTLGGISFAVNGGCAGADVNSGMVPVADTWYHVVGTYDGATISIYVNGGLKASSPYSAPLSTINTNPLYIGENAQQPGRYWSGDIDEVKIYGVALSAAQIAAGYANEKGNPLSVPPVPPKNWDGSARVCAATGPDHLEIQHGMGSGVTCAPSTLTIKACADTLVPCTAYTGGVSGTLSATGSPTVNWVGGSGFSIGSSGSVAKSVQITTPGSVTFGVASPAIPTTCNFGSPSCTFTASSAGAFVVAVPSHVSCVAQAPTVTMPAACGAALDGAKSIGFRFTYVNPNTGATPTPHVPYAGLGTPGAALALATGSDAPFNLTFSSGVATLPYFVYDDAGSLTLTASYTGSGTDAGLSMTGTSPPFVAAPASFAFSGIPAAPLIAGQAFNATVTAMNACAPPAATPNFINQTVTITSSNPLPAMGNATAINTTLTGFSNGTANASLTWNEVGTIDLNANLANYLGSTLSVSGTQAGVGRFIPHHFDMVVTQPGTTFTYSGQPFTTKVTAMNFAGTPTTNYNATAGFSKDVTLSAWDSTGVTANPGPGALTPTQPPAIVLASAFTSTSTGAATVATPTYTFTTAKTAPTTIRIRATDTDLVSSSDGVTEGTAVIRSGRLRVSNAFGSEKANLRLAINAEYWTGLSWLLNGDDSFSLIPIAAIALNPSVVTGSTVQSPVTLASGKGSIVLLKPTSGTGMVDLAINLGIGTADLSCLTTHPATTGAGLPWLRSLNGSCAVTYDRDPSARATFGIYSPETRKTIHVRELY